MSGIIDIYSPYFSFMNLQCNLYPWLRLGHKFPWWTINEKSWAINLYNALQNWVITISLCWPSCWLWQHLAPWPSVFIENSELLLICLQECHDGDFVQCSQLFLSIWVFCCICCRILNPLDIIYKLKLHRTSRKCPGHLLNVLCMFSLRSVSRGKALI